MRIRFYNARILTMADGFDLVEGELWTEDNWIVHVGGDCSPETICNACGAETLPFEQEIDCKGNVLMPGFKNAHTHSGMTAFRSYADDMPLHEWLQTKIFPIEAEMSGEDVYYLTKLAILEYLTTGVTAIMDMYLMPETIAEACIAMGMRCVLVSGLNDFGPELSVMEERFLQLNDMHPLISYKMGIHAEYTCSKELLQRVSELLHKYRAPLYTHLSETKEEVDGCLQRWGMTPAVFLNSLGLFDFGGGGFHGVHVTEEDLTLFAEKKLSMVTNPGSNTKLASGIAPVCEYLERGINLAIGTDGPSSNNCLDLFREMFLVTGLAKLRQQDAAAADANQVLKMATVNGAVTMQLADADVLAPGKLADIIMIDLHQPNMQPLNDITKNIVYSGSKQNVKMTMIDGVIRYYDGEFYCGEDPEFIYEKANEIIKKLHQAVNGSVGKPV